ncbi:MAG: hypothetical protein O8C59_02060 [Candidatus Methanoperedens sp.]|nr:hypothetical protein [Candidatus Methanoperedens sp.]
MGRKGKLTIIAIAATAALIFALPTAIAEGTMQYEFLMIVMLLIATIVILISMLK